MAQKFLSDIHPTAGLKDSSGDLGSNGQVLSSTGAGTNWVQAGSGATVIHDDQFTATAGQTAFTLSNTVDAENKTQVYIDGAYQAKAGYTVSGTTLTFDTGLDVGSKVEVMTFATAIASNATAVIKLDEFVPGDAISGTSGQNFTLSQTVSDEKVTQVYINGVYQHKDTYSISGTTLQFSSAPPSGSDIEVITFDTVVAADGTLSATTFLGDLNGTINTATTATTQSAGNNSTKISTTAYTDAKVADAINNGTTAIAPSQNAVFDALALKSNIASPTFTGTPAAPTASAGTNTTQLATTAFVTTGIANIVDSSPGALNTLNELAAALGDDANFSTTVTNSIATKLPLAGGTLTGNLSARRGSFGTASNFNFDLYNNGTSYFNGAVTIDDNATIAGNLTITQNSGSLQFSNTGSGHASITTGSSKDLNIASSSGNVYINNNTTFSGNVEVIKSSTPTIQLTQSGSTNYKGYVKLAGNDLEIRGSSGVMEFYNGSVDGNSSALRMSISSGGIVGIGSTGIFAGSAAILNLQGIGIALKNDKNGSNNNWSYIQNTGTGSSSDINFYTGNNSSALNLSHSGTAAFSGDVNIFKASAIMSVGTSGSGGSFGFMGWDDSTNSLYLGNSYNSAFNKNLTISSAGNVGIGTTSPSQAIEVKGDSKRIAIRNQGGGDGLGGIRWINDLGTPMWDFVHTSATGHLHLKDLPSGITAMTIKYGSGKVGIGTTAPGTTLDVRGTTTLDASAIANNPLIIKSDNGGGLITFIRGSAFTQMYMSSTTSGNQFYVASQGSGGVVLATGGTSWGNGSDARLKKNFETTQGLSEVLQIEPIKYHLKTQDNSETKKLGFKAQNLQTLIPEMILDMDEEDPEDGSKYLGIIPDYLFPVLVKAIQEQQTIIEDLKSRIETLEG